MHAMADFGPTSVTSSEFNYNAPPFLMKQDVISTQSDHKANVKPGDFNTDRDQSSDIFNKGDRLDDSKDSDEGFSSSFSPTSETQMLQDPTAAATLWGNNNRDEFFLPGFPMSAANVASPLLHNGALGPMNVNTGFAANSRRVGSATSPLGHIRRPTPALSSYLASNKAMANALGVSGWPSNQHQVSSWPGAQPPIGTTFASNNFQPGGWNSSSRSSQASSMPFAMQTNLQQQQFKSSFSSQMQDQFQASMNSANLSMQAKNMKNRSFNNSPLPMSHNLKISSPFSTTASSGSINSLSSINTGLESTIVDDITQLTNSFSNLHTVNQSHAISNGLFSNQQDRRLEDGMKYSSLESRLLGDVFKSTLDNDSSYDTFRYQLQKKSFAGRDADQIVPSIGSSLNGSPRSDLDLGIERYSRKVFVGGLPPDIDEDEIHASFCRFGPLTVDWPHKAESKSYFPPKGYAFLLYKDEISVQRLIDCCIVQDGKLYLCVSSPTIKDKPVQIRPWNLGDADFVMDGSQPLDPRKTIFVGGVPRPLRAVELAMIMDRLYGGVCYSGIDVDPELKYPKGAGRVAFSNQQSYIAAISARFIQLQHGEIDKRVEVKPYVLDDQMCDECHGVRCNGKFAPFFCSNITCLQYYCEQCWAIIHSRPGREFHKPLVKEGGDRPRQNTLGFRWPLKGHPTIPSLPSMPLLP